jgi:hypothetical protein
MRGGQIIEATIVSAPKHNSGEENETIKEGETPRLEIQARQEPPEGQGRALDEEA